MWPPNITRTCLQSTHPRSLGPSMSSSSTREVVFKNLRPSQSNAPWRLSQESASLIQAMQFCDPLNIADWFAISFSALSLPSWGMQNKSSQTKAKPNCISCLGRSRTSYNVFSGTSHGTPGTKISELVRQRPQVWLMHVYAGQFASSCTITVFCELASHK